jgi:hypothetical protein
MVNADLNVGHDTNTKQPRPPKKDGNYRKVNHTTNQNAFLN